MVRLSGKLITCFVEVRQFSWYYRSIVNGLRDEDAESSYASRSSFASDNSMQPQPDGVQVFFREHGRAGSKGSNSSFLARKKFSPGQSRPETKVQVKRLCYFRSLILSCAGVLQFFQPNWSSHRESLGRTGGWLVQLRAHQSSRSLKPFVVSFRRGHALDCGRTS